MGLAWSLDQTLAASKASRAPQTSQDAMSPREADLSSAASGIGELRGEAPATSPQDVSVEHGAQKRVQPVHPKFLVFLGAAFWGLVVDKDMPEDVVEVSVRKTFVHVDLAAAASTRRPTRRHASAPAAGGRRIPPPADAPRASTDPYAQTSVTMQENLEERSISDKVDSKFDSDSDRDMFVYHAWSLSSREAEAKDSAESSCLLPGE
ncbi:unnamed protein product, partial [Effrenium voratum]